jgi:hypothetical protein
VINVWGQEHKSQTDSELIEGAIARMLQVHDDDPESHLDTGQALQSHKASEIIDHLAESIVNDKLVSIARAYTAIVKIPTTANQDIFFGGIDYAEQALVAVSPSKTIAEIFGRINSGDDSEYVYIPVNSYGYNYFMTLPAVIPAGLKVHTAKLKFRAKIINATVATEYAELSFGDGNVEPLTITNAWADYEFTFYTLEDNAGVFRGINQDTLNRAGIGLNTNQEGGDATKNQIAISKFYLEIAVVADVDKEDFSNIFDAVYYCNSLGGGSIFVKNGTYECQMGKAHLSSFVDIYGESLAGCILHSSYGVATLVCGADEQVQYNTGTITLTQNSAVVVASGITWTAVKTVGKYLLDRRTGHYYKILSREDSTHITLTEKYQGNTASSLAYVIIGMNTENSVHDMTLQTNIEFYGAIDNLLENVDVVGHMPILVYAENLVFRDISLSGVVVTTNINYICNSKFIDMTVKGCSLVPFSMQSTCSGNIFSDNLFIDNLVQCVLIYGFNTMLKGNVFLNNGWSAGQLYPPVLLGSTSYKNIICNNIMRNNNSYGIGSQTGANYNLVHGNVCIDNYSAGISNVGANSLTNDNIV